MSLDYFAHTPSGGGGNAAWGALKPAVVLARVATQLQAQQARNWLRAHNEALESEVARRMVENDLTQRVAIRSLAHLAATRDPETGNHILRTQAYVRRHHEKWDGSGYPDGLVGEAIPVSARLMALADVFDALISKRVYKEAMTCSAARDIIVQGSGAHFDPAVVAAFLAAFSDFEAIAGRYSDAG